MKSYNLNLLWITLFMLSVHHPRIADSFQCYECENCPTIGENDKKYLKECGLPENHRPNRPGTTLAWEGQEEEEEEEDDNGEVDDHSSHIQELVDTPTTSTSTSTSTTTSTSTSTSTTMSSSTLSSTVNTTEIITPTTTDGTSEEDTANSTTSTTESETSEEKKETEAWSLFPHSMEENDLISSRSEENLPTKKVRKARQLPGNRPVCYVLTLKYDGFEITNRGCGAAIADRNLTCKMLSKGQPYAECDICEGDMCNSAPSVINGVMGTLYVLVLIAVYSW